MSPLGLAWNYPSLHSSLVSFQTRTLAEAGCRTRRQQGSGSFSSCWLCLPCCRRETEFSWALVSSTSSSIVSQGCYTAIQTPCRDQHQYQRLQSVAVGSTKFCRRGLDASLPVSCPLRAPAQALLFQEAEQMQHGSSSDAHECWRHRFCESDFFC